uniref:Uncharacterized protein n=1 Tax=Setaria viridis TaxID=4556 RepID=A0A4U6UW79_SETVI|nr:hypothetical protein SEVIR_4G060600v2 [Setaria viridis]
MPSPPIPTSPVSTSGIAELLSTTEQGLLPNLPPAPGRRGWRLKKTPVSFSGLCHSKHQACSRVKHLSAEERVNHVLCRRLGYIKDDFTPAEEAIRDFIVTFQGPIP